MLVRPRASTPWQEAQRARKSSRPCSSAAESPANGLFFCRSARGIARSRMNRAVSASKAVGVDVARKPRHLSATTPNTTTMIAIRVPRTNDFRTFIYTLAPIEFALRVLKGKTGNHTGCPRLPLNPLLSPWAQPTGPAGVDDQGLLSPDRQS